MLVWLKISIRNILKNSRRSIITIMAIALGFVAVNLFQGYVHSTYKKLKKSAIQGEGLAHLTIYKKDYLTKGKIYPEKYMFNQEENQKITQLVKKIPEVKLITPRLDVSGIISNGKNSQIFISQGLVPDEDLLIRGDITETNPIQGQYLAQDDPSGVVIASGLAEILNLKIGDYAVIMSNTLDGMANALDIRVRGVMNTALAATNDKLLLMTYRHAQSLFDTNSSDRLVVLLKDESQTALVQSRLSRILRENGFDVEVKTWYELSDFYKQVKNMFDMIFAFIFTIVLVIVIMSIINTMTMSIMERTRETGTMRALGANRSTVRILFATEGAVLGLLGCGVGIILSVCAYLSIKSANITYIPPAASVPVPLEIDMVWPTIIKNLFAMTFLAVIASFFPAKRASKKSIIDALGHV